MRAKSRHSSTNESGPGYNNSPAGCAGQISVQRAANIVIVNHHQVSPQSVVVLNTLKSYVIFYIMTSTMSTMYIMIILLSG